MFSLRYFSLISTCFTLLFYIVIVKIFSSINVCLQVGGEVGINIRNRIDVEGFRQKTLTMSDNNKILIKFCSICFLIAVLPPMRFFKQKKSSSWTFAFYLSGPRGGPRGAPDKFWGPPTLCPPHSQKRSGAPGPIWTVSRLNVGFKC